MRVLGVRNGLQIWKQYGFSDCKPLCVNGEILLQDIEMCSGRVDMAIDGEDNKASL